MLEALLHDNPYFTAGFGLLGVGAVFAGLRQGIVRVLYMAQRKYITTVEVTSKDPAYSWIVNWLTRQSLSSGSHFTLNANSIKSTSTSMNKSNELAKLAPAPGVHFLRWEKRWIKVDRQREKSNMLDLASGMPFETITLSIIGRNVNFINQLIAEAHNFVAKQEQGKLLIYTGWAAEWRVFGNPRRKRLLDSIIFDVGVKDRIVADVHEFLRSSQWYSERGIPYRRGYLLHGPPGGGKSSFVQAIASELDYSICLLNLSESNVTDDRLNHLLNAMPDKSILLLEDVDSVMNPDRPSGKGLTLSGLLNAIDGVAAAEERLIFMTTNHYDKLDAALIRPGRVDLQQYIGPASSYQIKSMFLRFYPDHGHLADVFAETVAPLHVSTAAVQGHFIQNKGNPLDCLKNAHLITGPNKSIDRNEIDMVEKQLFV